MRSPEEPILVKKYANRRLFNTGTGTYIELEDLAGVVKRGDDIAIYDAGSGNDTTRLILMLITPTTTEH